MYLRDEVWSMHMYGTPGAFFHASQQSCSATQCLKMHDHRKGPPILIEQSMPDCSIRVNDKYIDFSVNKQGFIAWYIERVLSSTLALC